MTRRPADFIGLSRALRREIWYQLTQNIALFPGYRSGGLRSDNFALGATRKSASDLAIPGCQLPRLKERATVQVIAGLGMSDHENVDSIDWSVV